MAFGGHATSCPGCGAAFPSSARGREVWGAVLVRTADEGGERAMSNLDEFDTVIRRKSGAAIAAVPRLGLYAQGPDVASALAALEQKKTALFADIDAGLVDADLITKPEQVQLRNVRTANVGVFALKTGIFIVLATLGALVAATLISAKREAAIDRVGFAAESAL